MEYTSYITDVAGELVNQYLSEYDSLTDLELDSVANDIVADEIMDRIIEREEMVIRELVGVESILATLDEKTKQKLIQTMTEDLTTLVKTIYKHQ